VVFFGEVKEVSKLGKAYHSGPENSGNWTIEKHPDAPKKWNYPSGRCFIYIDKPE